MFIANFRRIFNNVDDKLRASVLWVLIINNTIPLLSFVLSKNPGGMSDLPVYLMPVGNIYIILALLFSYLMNYMKVFKDDVERQVLLRMAYTDSMTGLYNRAKSMEEFEKLDNGSEAYCVLRMLKLTAKMRKEAVDPQSWLGLVADENAVRAALPIREAIFLLQKGTLSKDEVKYRKLWLRSWVYTIATLVLVYVQPQLASGSEAAMSLTLVLCQSLAAYAQGLLIKALADFRRTRIQK